jgi:hypothetical protein
MTRLRVTIRADGTGYGFQASSDVTQLQGTDDLVRGSYVMGGGDDGDVEVYEFDGHLEAFYWNQGQGYYELVE